MGKITERLSEIAKRCGDLSPLAEPIRQRLWEGNRAAVLAGVTPTGERVKPLAPSTLKRRKGAGPPRAPFGANSRVVTQYVVQVTAGPARLSVVSSWPGFPVVEYIDLTRPTFGFRPEDLQWCRDQMRTHVTK